MEKIKHDIENIFAICIGTKKEIQEIAICRRENDNKDNVYYRDLLTNTIYPTSSSDEKEIIVQKIYTLLGILKSTTLRNKILENRYLTNHDLLLLYDALNEDTEYQTRKWHKNDNVFEAPSFVQTYTWLSQTIIDENQEEISAFIISLKTNLKPLIITGEKGTGVSMIRDRLLKTISGTDIEDIKIERIFLEYKSIIKDTSTTLHIKKRIAKTINFVKKAEYKNVVINDVDFQNETFINEIIKQFKQNEMKLVLISSNQLDENLFDKSLYDFISIKAPSKNLITRIFSLHLDMKEKKFTISIPRQELISILLECDQIQSMNIGNYTKNPKLGINVINNAALIASADLRKNITIQDFIDAFDIVNINMDTQTKNSVKKKLEELQQRKLIQQPKEKKKSFFFRNTKD